MGGTLAQVRTLMARFGDRCVHCGKAVHVSAVIRHDLCATRDHEIPECRGGGNGSNIILACHRCNQVKGDMTGDEFRELRRTGTLPRSYADYLAQKKLRQLDAN